ncbi:histidine--tRNA ligase [Candidatus Dependentiae bacterium]|nr:histidine--tRNA ligase [Candidatus Dependentiae bacterium]
MYSKVKGVTDNFFDMIYWSGVRKKIETHLKKYNFSEIELPTLEHVSLFERGLGFETDVVSKQMFLIQSRGDNEEQICLRPEGTAGTMRAFLEQQAAMPIPCNVYSYGSMFRYERPQKGRFREFHQFNFEMIGAHSLFYDVWCIKMLHTLFLEVLEIDNFVLKLNYLGQSQDRHEYMIALRNFLEKKQALLCETCVRRLKTNVLRILDCKSKSCQKLLQDAPQLFSFFSEETKEEWQRLCNGLQELSVTFIHDQQLVRGLDYYNKTVFEFVSTELGAQNTFCAGGRYDGLAEQLGSKQSIPSVGGAIGMERLLLILESKKEALSEKRLPLSCIIPCAPEQYILALLLADFLQSHNKCVDILFDGTSLKNKMKKANNAGAHYVLILGENEQNTHSVTVKNMTTGQEQIVLQTEVHKIIF